MNDIRVLNLYILNNMTLKYIKQKLAELQEKCMNSQPLWEILTSTLSNFNTDRWKISQDLEYIDMQLTNNLMDSRKNSEGAICPCTNRTFTKINHMSSSRANFQGGDARHISKFSDQNTDCAGS